MADTDYVEMDDEELAAFLGSGGTGVLSLSAPDDGPPYSVPVSYGFDADEGDFFFRLAVGADSEKDPALESPTATFVAYDLDEDGWQSVVASGELEAVSEAEVASGVLDGLGRTAIPMYDVFDRPTRRVSFGFYRLDPGKFTGRRGTHGPETG
jgi:hypothetical protein